MVRLRYTTLASDGTCATHERDVEDTSLLTRELEQQGVIVVSTETIKAEQSRFSFRGTLKPRAITAFLRELSLILRSGLPLAESLDLRHKILTYVSPRLFRALRRDIVSGAAFAQALERRSDIFTPDIIAMARVAEATGDYDTVFRALAQERERSHVLLDKVTNTLRYPLFLICARCCFFSSFCSTSSRNFPRSSPSSNDRRMDLRCDFRTVRLASRQSAVPYRWLRSGPLLRASHLANASGERCVASRLCDVADHWLAPVDAPLCAPAVQSLSLTRTGFPLIEALSVTESIVGTDAKAEFGRVQDVVRRGGRLNEGLNDVNLLPKLAVRMLKIGEETGELAKTAGEAGQLYMEKLERTARASDRFHRAGRNTFYCRMIGSIMVSIMMAILSVNDLAM